MQLALSACRLGIDWRPVLGITPQDAGGLIELVLARVLTTAAVELHNEEQEAKAAAYASM